MRPLIFASLQPELAEAKGVPLRFVSTAFLAIVALAVSESAQIVGILLVFSLMVGPPATAQRLVTGLWSGMALSAALALAEAWLGIAIAYYTDWPVSFCIAMLSALGYFVTRGSCPPRRSPRRPAVWLGKSGQPLPPDRRCGSDTSRKATTVSIAKAKAGGHLRSGVRNQDDERAKGPAPSALARC